MSTAITSPASNASSTFNSRQTSEARSHQQEEYSADESDTTDEISDEEYEEQCELFLQEYFHQQFLKMQAIYPPTFKSKLRQFQDSNLDSEHDSISKPLGRNSSGNAVSTSGASSQLQNNEKSSQSFSFFRRQKKAWSLTLNEPIDNKNSNRIAAQQKKGASNKIPSMLAKRLGIVFFERKAITHSS